MMRFAQALGKLKMVSELSHEKNIISFRYIACLINGILIIVYYKFPV